MLRAQFRNFSNTPRLSVSDVHKLTTVRAHCATRGRRRWEDPEPKLLPSPPLWTSTTALNLAATPRLIVKGLTQTQLDAL